MDFVCAAIVVDSGGEFGGGPLQFLFFLISLSVIQSHLDCCALSVEPVRICRGIGISFFYLSLASRAFNALFLSPSSDSSPSWEQLGVGNRHLGEGGIPVCGCWFFDFAKGFRLADAC